MKKWGQYFVDIDGSVYNRYGLKLKPQKQYKGYLVLGLRADGRSITKGIHRLVAETYLDNPNNLSDVDHIDGDRTNNHLSNLRWLSHGDNIKHSYDSGRRSATGTNNARCKSDLSDIHNICFLLERGYTSVCIRDMGFRYELVRTIKTRQNWRTISNSYHF